MLRVEKHANLFFRRKGIKIFSKWKQNSATKAPRREKNTKKIFVGAALCGRPHSGQPRRVAPTNIK
jgi:hypothetical protein